MSSDLHQRFAYDRNMRVDVSVPKAFPLPDGLRRTLIKYLRQFDFISAAYLAQFSYVGDTDPRVGNHPCLTLGLVIDRPDFEQLVTEVSRQATEVLSGQLGEWHFLDFVPVTPQTMRAFQVSALPIYTKQGEYDVLPNNALEPTATARSVLTDTGNVSIIIPGGSLLPVAVAQLGFVRPFVERFVDTQNT